MTEIVDPKIDSRITTSHHLPLATPYRQVQSFGSGSVPLSLDLCFWCSGNDGTDGGGIDRQLMVIVTISLS